MDKNAMIRKGLGIAKVGAAWFIGLAMGLTDPVLDAETVKDGFNDLTHAEQTEIAQELIDSAKKPLKTSLDGKQAIIEDKDECIKELKTQIEDLKTQIEEAAKPVQAVEEEPEEAEEVKEKPQEETLAQKNAKQQARDYLSIMSFSRKGLINQLEYEGYSTEDATYAVDNITVDWKEQCAEQARDYLSVMSFSRGRLADQLEYEGYTQEEIEHGLKAVGY